jgi:hypothetical protein
MATVGWHRIQGQSEPVSLAFRRACKGAWHRIQGQSEPVSLAFRRACEGAWHRISGPVCACFASIPSRFQRCLARLQRCLAPDFRAGLCLFR